MGIIEARIDGGPHKALIQLSPHFKYATDYAKGVGRFITFPHFEEELQRQPVIFLEGTQSLPPRVWQQSKVVRLREFERLRAAVEADLNRVLAHSSPEALAQSSEVLRRFKPHLVYADVFDKPGLYRLHLEELKSMRSQSRWVTALSLLTGGGVAAHAVIKKRKEKKKAGKKGRRKKRAAEKMTRRAFLARMGAGALTAAGGSGLGWEMHPKSYGVSPRLLAHPGRIGLFRDVIRKVEATYNRQLTAVDLRNAIMAEKIARSARQMFGDQPVDVGVAVAPGHAGIKEHLEDPAFRRAVIAGTPNLSELVDEAWTGLARHAEFDPKKGLYVVKDRHVGFK